MRVLLLPGLGGSGEGHWQRWWSEGEANARVIEQADWNAPELSAWIDNVAAAAQRGAPPILVGHSLGAALIPHLAARRPGVAIAGALIVAPADVEENPRLRVAAPDFAPIPRIRLQFPSIVAASANDPYMALSRAQGFAGSWGSRFFDLGDAGHVNIASGFGAWPAGLALARQLWRRSVWPSLLPSSASPTIDDTRYAR
jgi:predicted alpha/beta hydrolase family esterase